MQDETEKPIRSDKTEADDERSVGGKPKSRLEKKKDAGWDQSPDPHTARRLAIRLFYTFASVILIYLLTIAIVASVATDLSTGERVALLKDAFDQIFPVLTALIASVVTYYFTKVKH